MYPLHVQTLHASIHRRLLQDAIPTMPAAVVQPGRLSPPQPTPSPPAGGNSDLTIVIVATAGVTSIIFILVFVTIFLCRATTCTGRHFTTEALRRFAPTREGFWPVHWIQPERQQPTHRAPSRARETSDPHSLA